MKKVILLILIVSFSFGIRDGNSLYDDGYSLYNRPLNPTNKYETEIYEEALKAGTYIGYIFGVVNLGQEMSFFCPPKNVDGIQISDLIYKYLKDHPEERNLKAEFLIIKALREVWPCPKNNSK